MDDTELRKLAEDVLERDKIAKNLSMELPLRHLVFNTKAAPKLAHAWLEEQAEIARQVVEIRVLHELNAQYLYEKGEEIARQRAALEMAREVLKEVEFSDDDNDGRYLRCRWCSKLHDPYNKRDSKHAPDCQRQAALAAIEACLAGADAEATKAYADWAKSTIGRMQADIDRLHGQIRNLQKGG